MSFKSIIQIFILITIFFILGVVYLEYFSKEKITSSQSIEADSAMQKENIQRENKLSNNKTKNENLNKNDKKRAKLEKKKSKEYSNLVKEIEYITIDKNGNNYKILAKEGIVDKDSFNLLTLKKVKGEITSNKRSKITIEADQAEYNSINLNTKFTKNIILKYENKLIKCENLDINMDNNQARAYTKLIITDEKSTLKANIIIINLLTGKIQINPLGT